MSLTLRSSSRGYLIAVAGVALATAARVALDPLLGDSFPFLAFFVAIFLAAWYGGFGSTALAVCLSWLALDRFLLAPHGRVPIFGARWQLAFAFFLVGLVVSLLAGALRTARRRAQASASEARRVQEEQRAVRERLRTTLGSIADAVITADPEGRVTSLNPAAERLTGWGAAEATGRTIGEVFRLDEDAGEIRASADLPPTTCANVRGDEAAHPDDCHILVARDRTTHWVESSTAPIKDESGAVSGTVIVLRDVTSRKRSERALQESEEQYRAVYSQAATGIGEADLTGRIVRVNDRYCEIMGHSREELLGMRIADLTHPDDRAEDRSRFERLIGGGPKYTVEKRYVRKDGSPVWVRVAASLIRDGSGCPARVAAVTEDITDRKRSEQALREQAESLREADRRKEEFLAVLSHELRNPLASIQTSLDLMSQGGLTGAKLERERGVVERQVQQLTRLVDDLLDVSRISRGRLELRKEEVALSAVVTEVVEAVRPLVAERRQELQVTLPEGPILLEADPTRLEQILLNLLTNAVKYTETGGRIALDVGRDRDDVVVQVRDTGIGIAPEMLGRIFDLFVQGENLLDQPRGGMGIGLNLVKNLVEKHGGVISARSEGTGKGSEFIVRLPALPRAQPRAEAPGGPRPTRPDAGEALPRRRILVVDDNAVAADGLGRLLALVLGQEVRVVYDGPTALDVAGSFRPEVVFLDLGMAVMDGFEVGMRLRERPDGHAMKIVALTGWGQAEDRRRTRDVGFDLHLVKPVNVGVLKALLAGPAPEAPGTGLLEAGSGAARR
jgi:PAS domain S-box-containing protein